MSAVIADTLFKALHRHSVLAADTLGLDLTAQELEHIRRRLVLAWFMEQLTNDDILALQTHLQLWGGYQ